VLTRLEFDLLAHLVRHRGVPFDRQALLVAVWSSSSAWQSTTTVTEHVRRLRLKIELDVAAPRLIETVSGAGYRFAEASTAETDGVAGSAVQLVAGVQDAMGIVSGTTIIFATDALAILTGRSTAAEIIGHDVFEFVASSSVVATKARHLSVKNGYWPRPELMNVVTATGSEVEVEITSTPVVYHGEMASQVTMWPVVPESLHHRATGIDAATEVADSVVVTNAEFEIQSINRAAELLYGWTEAEVVGRIVLDVIPWEGSADELTEIATRLFTTGRWHGEVQQRTREGETIATAATMTVIRDGGGAVVGVISVNRPLHAMSRVLAGPESVDDDLVADIHRGLAASEFEVHYQPIVELEHELTVGVEALVRWRHPDRGLLAPAAFIDAAERSGAIVDLGRFVITTACEQAARWRNDGYELGMGVNVSTRQLADDDLTTEIEKVVARTKMPIGALWLEVTETALVEDLDHAEVVLTRLASLGAHVAIDDFGTGWASLTYLHQFPVHTLKIDRLFVAGLCDAGNDVAIVRSIVSLAGELGLGIVAEGVETTAQLEHLRALGCPMAQGYLFGRPVPAADVDLARCIRTVPVVMAR
jgi:PAS domain S-box-containing protein